MTANAALINSFQFNGTGNWSLDAVGSNSTPVGDLSALVPVGGTVEQAFLYSSTFGNAPTPTVNFDGTVLSGADFTPLGVTSASNLQAFRADVTGQVAAKVGGGSAVPFIFSILSETPNGSVDGEVLAVIYSDPTEPERTIAFLDGFSLPAGDATVINLGDPLDTTIPGFEALLSAGIGFGFQGTVQFSNIDVNGRRLTSSAGGQDDGGSFNGGLITVGDLFDDPTNPPDPFAGPNGNPAFDDELYNLALGNGVDPTPFLADGINAINIDTLNPSNDDNIFFLGINITARAGVNQPPPPPGPPQPPPPTGVPEPTTLALFGFGLLGLGLARRRGTWA
ncbi:MAG: PEP-CTERM sorting domain-containing protein [Sphingomonadales bacterium]